jgi:hypothetical protein
MMDLDSTHQMGFAQKRITQIGLSIQKLWHFEFQLFLKMI